MSDHDERANRERTTYDDVLGGSSADESERGKSSREVHCERAKKAWLRGRMVGRKKRTFEGGEVGCVFRPPFITAHPRRPLQQQVGSPACVIFLRQATRLRGRLLSSLACGA